MAARALGSHLPPPLPLVLEAKQMNSFGRILKRGVPLGSTSEEWVERNEEVPTHFLFFSLIRLSGGNPPAREFFPYLFPTEKELAFDRWRGVDDKSGERRCRNRSEKAMERERERET